MNVKHLQAVFVFFLIVLITGQTLVFSLPLWENLQELTTKEPQAQNVSVQVHSYLTSYETIGLPQIEGFTDKENSHMFDVKRLINALELFLFFCLFGLLITYLKSYQLSQGLFLGSCAVMTALVLALLIPFDSLFIWFHKIFFRADTWTFTDGLMIRSFTKAFFAWMAQIWWIRAFVSAAMIVAACIITQVIKGRPQQSLYTK